MEGETFRAYTGPALPVHDVVLSVPRVPMPAALQEVKKGRRHRDALDSSGANRVANSGAQADIAAIHENWVKYQRFLDILENERLAG